MPMRELDQEVASVIQFINTTAGEDVSPYYWKMPADFIVPAVYYPSPEITTNGDALNSYEMSYTWYIKFFCVEDEDAHQIALNVLTAIQGARRCIPLIAPDGSRTGRDFKLLDPRIRPVERGVWQMEVRWESPRYYDREAVQKAVMLYISGLGGSLYGNKDD